MDNITENDNTNDPNTLSSKTVETVEKTKKNENLNGHRNEKKRLRNVWLQEKTKSKYKCNQNKNKKIEKFILRLLLIRV